MLLVLPPSRGQTPAPDGAAPLDPDALALPSLAPARRSMLAALAGTERDVTSAPAAPAAEVFTGVLFAAARLPELLSSRGAAGSRTRESVLIASPLLGVVRPHDRLPASRLGMGTVAGMGGVAAFWREPLRAALDPLADDRLVVDLRSSEFLPLWRPPASAPWVAVRVEQRLADGARRVASHHAKHWRGLLVHHLLTRRGTEPDDARTLLRAARGLVTRGEILAVELTPAARAGQPDVVTLVSA